MSRAIRHAFDALEALNHHEALRISEFSRVLDLPRSTTVRAIRALDSMGYIERRADDERYVLTQRVLRLGSGYGETHRLVQVARPILDALCADVGWPIALVLPRGLDLRVYYTTDDRTPRKIFRSSAGDDLPLRDTASGVVYLAHCDEVTRRLLLDAADAEAPVACARRTDAQLEADLAFVRRAGYCFQDHSHVVSKQFDGFQSKECVLAVPILPAAGKILGVLAARPLTRAVKRDWVETVLLACLRRGAAEIAATAGQESAAVPAPARGEANAAASRRPAKSPSKAAKLPARSP